MSLKNICVLCSFFLLFSCFSTGTFFPSNLEWIKQEKTKREEVNNLLGKPFAVGNSSGVETWTYAYYQYKIFGPTLFKELKFYWKEDHSLKDFSFNSNFPTDLTPSTNHTTETPKY